MQKEGASPGDEITVLDAFKAMRTFLERFWERGHRQDDTLANLLSWTAMDPRTTPTGKVGTADPAQWYDWVEAVTDTLERHDK
jgi:hypothetical protein